MVRTKPNRFLQKSIPLPSDKESYRPITGEFHHNPVRRTGQVPALKRMQKITGGPEHYSNAVSESHPVPLGAKLRTYKAVLSKSGIHLPH